MNPSKEMTLIIKREHFPQTSLESLLQEVKILGSDLWFRTRLKNTNSLITRAMKLLHLSARQKVLQTDLQWQVRTHVFPPNFYVQILCFPFKIACPLHMHAMHSTAHLELIAYFYLQSLSQVVIFKTAGYKKRHLYLFLPQNNSSIPVNHMFTVFFPQFSSAASIRMQKVTPAWFSLVAVQSGQEQKVEELETRVVEAESPTKDSPSHSHAATTAKA